MVLIIVAVRFPKAKQKKVYENTVLFHFIFIFFFYFLVVAQQNKEDKRKHTTFKAHTLKKRDMQQSIKTLKHAKRMVALPALNYFK